MAPTTSRWRALMALLRPDARRWVGLGALVGLSSALALAGPLVVRRIVDIAPPASSEPAPAPTPSHGSPRWPSSF